MPRRNAALELIEPVPVDDDLCTRIALIEDLGFAARFILVQDQTCFESRSRVTVIKRKIVLPYAALAPSLDMTQAFMGRRPSTQPFQRRRLRLIRG